MDKDNKLLIADLEQIKEYLDCKGKDFWSLRIKEVISVLNKNAVEFIEVEKSIQEINKEMLRKEYINGLPDNLIYDINKPLGETSRELWLRYLKDKSLTESEYEELDYYEHYKIYCSYCNKYNIPHIED